MHTLLIRLLIFLTIAVCIPIENCFVLAAPPVPESSPVSPQDSLKYFQLDPGLKIELVAAEPDVVDPIAIRFDDDGRMWVVEMRDYPLGPASGQPPLSKIKILEDKDRDGRYEKVTVFAEHLLFPTGLQPWNGGVIVTLAGKVAFMKDTNGDGQADVNETWYTGFAEENSQLRANHPRLMSDGWVYVANGLRGGTIVDARQPDSKPVAISGRDFRFHPVTGEYEAISGAGQFGMTFDEQGNRFVCSNRNPLVHVVMEERYAKKNPLYAVPSVVQDVAASGEKSRIFPLTRAWTTSNLHAGQFTAACGVKIFLGGGLGPDYRGNAFTCEPTGNLIHREVFSLGEGVSFTSKSPYADREFLASTDEWFRPVNTETGPDGAMYIVDMYRAVIEHPQFVPDELKNRPDQRWGDDRGRIYRIVATSDKSTKVATAKKITTAVTGRSREQMLSIVANQKQLPRNRFLSLLDLAPLRDDEIPTIKNLFVEQIDDVWMRRAVMIAVGQRADLLLQALVADKAIVAQLAVRDDLAPLSELVALALADKQDDVAFAHVVKAVAALEKSPEYSRAARTSLIAVQQSLAKQGTLLAKRSSKLDLQTQVAELNRVLVAERTVATNAQQTEIRRTEAIELLAFDEASADAITKVAFDDPSQMLRLRAITALSRIGTPETWKKMLASFPRESPTVRRAIMDGVLANKDRTAGLLDEIEADSVKVAELDRLQVDRLLKHSDATIKARAQKLLAAAIPADRVQVLANYQVALTMKGDSQRGRELFAKNCATCHKIGDLGVNVAPDISDSRVKTAAQYLVDILQPNRAIDNNYISYVVATNDGRFLTGILATETAGSITLRLPENKSVSLVRSEIEEIRSTGVSLMPEGLEKNIPPQAMADVISFIKNWRYLDGKTPFEQK